MANLTFLGAARTVTGSKYLLEHGGRRVLVDCGLFQGLKELRLRNWDDFPVPPDSIDAVVLTHAHLDHVGYLPRLCAQGYRGRVFCTAGTADLCGWCCRTPAAFRKRMPVRPTSTATRSISRRCRCTAKPMRGAR